MMRAGIRDSDTTETLSEFCACVVITVRLMVVFGFHEWEWYRAVA
jgi:hypothetical protein